MGGIQYESVKQPSQRRDTRIVRDATPDAIAQELEPGSRNNPMSKILFLAHPQADGSLANVAREAVAAAQAVAEQLPGSTLTPAAG